MTRAPAAIVSSADANYFPWLFDLITSIREHDPARLPICILDAGLTAEQREQLKPHVASIVDPGWDISLIAEAGLPSWFKAMSSRPFLPRHFPDYEILLWSDADIWMQDWRGIDLMIRAAAKYGFAIVPEVHQSYDYLYDIRRRADTRDFLFRAYNGPLNEDSARKLSQRAIFNSGFFAMRADSPVWPVWQKTLESMLPNVREHHRMVEQNALNVAIYGGSVEMPHRLPAWCNWLCAHALPALDPQSGLLVDPMIPHAPLSVIHMVGGMNAQVALDVVGGGTVTTQFNYRAGLTLRENARHRAKD